MQIFLDRTIDKSCLEINPDDMKHIILIFILIVVGMPAPANVISTGNQNFNPIPRGIAFLTVHSSETLKPGIFNLGLYFNNAVNSLPYFEDASQNASDFNDHLLGMDLNFGMGIAKNFDVGVSFPFVVAQSVESTGDHDLNYFPK